MKIESLEIDNFKSLNNFKIENPNPFSVFVGANGVGKSNIFEALEFLSYLSKSGRSNKDEEVSGDNNNESRQLEILTAPVLKNSFLFLGKS